MKQCTHCRFWSADYRAPAKTGYCRSRGHRQEVARELGENRRQLGWLITWHDDTCDYFSPATSLEVDADADTEPG